VTNVNLTLAARRVVRNAADASQNNLPVVAVEGDVVPTEKGHGFFYETRGGTRIDHPSAYSKHGWSNMVYRSSTRRVEVGRGWLVARGLVAVEPAAIEQMAA
jgi:hypothetical protein